MVPSEQRLYTTSYLLPNLEILTVSLRPYHLREFAHVVYSTIYIPDRSVAEPGAEKLCSAIQDIERSAPDAFIVMNGDARH